MDRFTLPKTHLLRATGEFQRVYRFGRRLRGEGFAVLFLANTCAFSRLGISVHRKAGNAVRRNRIKRLIREVFRLHRTMFPAAADVVVTVRPEFAIDRFADLHAGMERVLAGGEHEFVRA